MSKTLEDARREAAKSDAPPRVIPEINLADMLTDDGDDVGDYLDLSSPIHPWLDDVDDYGDL